MIRRFHSLFRISVLHTYYLDRVCPDFELIPTLSTDQKLRQYGLLFRPEENGCLTAFEAEDDIRTPTVKLEGEAVLTFKVRLKNPNFFNFTALPGIENGAIYYFDNLTGNSMDLQSMKLKPSIFKIPYSSGTKNISIRLTNHFGDEIYNKALSSETKIFNHEIDARMWKPGLYELQIKEGATTKLTERIYISDEMVASDAFAIVELYQKGGVKFDYTAAQIYSIGFAARAVPWKYLIELSKDYSGHSFNIEDKEDYSSPPAAANYPYISKIKFAETGAKTHKSGEVATFVSGTSSSNKVDIPFSEIPKKKLQLTVSNGSGQLVVQNLPNPSLSNGTQEVYLKI